MRKAFTLIEVLVASSIIAIVGAALMQTNINNSKLIKSMHRLYFLKEQFSLVLLNADEKMHNKSKNLYDFVSTNIPIKDDDTIKYLKNQKFTYTHKEFSKVELLSSKLKEYLNENFDFNANLDMKFTIEKVNIKNKNVNSQGFIVK